MAKSDYLSQNDDAFAAQMQAFKNAVAAYAATLGLTPAQVTAQAADADYFSYVLASAISSATPTASGAAGKVCSGPGAICRPAARPSLPFCPPRSRPSPRVSKSVSGRW